MTSTEGAGVRYLALALILLVCATAALLRPAFAPPQEPQARANSTAAIVSTLEQRLGNALPWIGVPGASVAVVRDGQMIDWQTGVTSAWTGARVRSDTQFEAASLSKPLTAYAVLRLAQKGRLDLDAAIVRAGHTFTLRQVLSHSAGFDNNLTAALEPRASPGQFAYAGAGYLFLGKVIAQTTGQSFEQHMNSVVLPELQMTHSQFGSRDDAPLALPSIDAGLPFAILVFIATAVGAPILILHAMAARAWRSTPRFQFRLSRHIIAALAVASGAAGLHWLVGPQNWPPLTFAGCAMLALGAGAWLLAARPSLAARGGAVLCAAAFVGLSIVRPPVPIAERKAVFLPAAGLRTTASDYARFLTHILKKADADAQLSAMLTPQVRANADHDWGLGIGLQRGETRSVWHWGVNFPGYQALAVANRQTGDVAVVLLNGGHMSFAPSGIRYSGLEVARSAISAIEGGRHSAYWQGIQ
ncbi:MAG: beta-lactamase family protein [Alphaproteobacteria bacterium]|nr:beta-lactamase family protein [Alphaproteobacteria bacterium]